MCKTDAKIGAEKYGSTEPMKMMRRIGSMTYEVSVHFSRTSKETIEDKILRLIEREVRQNA